VAGKPTLRSLFLIFVPIGLTYGFAEVLRLPFVLTELDGSELDFGLLDSLTLVAMVVAGLLMTLYSRRLRDGQWIVLSTLGVGLASIAFAASWSVRSAIVLSMAEGFLYAPTAIAASLIIERNTPRHMRGRVFSAFFVARDSMFLLGMLLAGLGDLFDVRLLYFLSGAVLLGTGVVAHFLPGLGRSMDRWFEQRCPVGLEPDPMPGRPLSPEEEAALLRVVPGLLGFGPEMVARLMAEAELVTAEQGAVIIRQDEVSDAAYFILAGTMTALRRVAGGREVLEVLIAGDFFGEIAALTGVPRTADVVASDDAQVIRLPAALWRDLSAQPGFGELVDDAMGRRLTRLGGCDAALPGRIDYQGLPALRTDGQAAETVPAA
jgi:CRP-like cAMP-binding protein